jgi:hypothetical protein
VPHGFFRVQVRLSPAQADWANGLGIRPSYLRTAAWHDKSTMNDWFSNRVEAEKAFRSKYKGCCATGEMHDFLEELDALPEATEQDFVQRKDAYKALDRVCKCKFYIARELVCHSFFTHMS